MRDRRMAYDVGYICAVYRSPIIALLVLCNGFTSQSQVRGNQRARRETNSHDVARRCSGARVSHCARTVSPMHDAGGDPAYDLGTSRLHAKFTATRQLHASC
jgi:hypothetical protein